jgi:hypothetical protein
VPQNQGPWFGYEPMSVWVPNLERRIAQISGEAPSISLREPIVNQKSYSDK